MKLGDNRLCKKANASQQLGKSCIKQMYMFDDILPSLEQGLGMWGEPRTTLVQRHHSRS